MSTKIQQYLHRPNSTEMGQSRTHDTYLYVNLELKSMFPNGVSQLFVDTTTKKEYAIMSAIGREFRINQMGEFYRDRNIRPGDEIVLQKVITPNGTSFFIDVNQFDRVLFYKYSKGYDITNIDRLPSLSPQNSNFDISVIWRKTKGILSIQFYKADKKRSDSPELTDFYHLLFNGQEITERNLMLTIGEQNILSQFNKYEFHEIIWED